MAQELRAQAIDVLAAPLGGDILAACSNHHCCTYHHHHLCYDWSCLILDLTVSFVLGHSLGGALATLAAYDIRKQLQEGGRQCVEVVCYSFGAPRTGNHAFARDYNHVVPDTWSIINDQVHPTFMARYAAATT